MGRSQNLKIKQVFLIINTSFFLINNLKETKCPTSKCQKTWWSSAPSSKPMVTKSMTRPASLLENFLTCTKILVKIWWLFFVVPKNSSLWTLKAKCCSKARIMRPESLCRKVPLKSNKLLLNHESCDLLQYLIIPNNCDKVQY